MQCIRPPRCASTLTLTPRQACRDGYGRLHSQALTLIWVVKWQGLTCKTRVCGDAANVNVAILSISEDPSASRDGWGYSSFLYITWHSYAANNHDCSNKNNTSFEYQDAKRGPPLGACGWKIKFPFSLPQMRPANQSPNWGMSVFEIQAITMHLCFGVFPLQASAYAVQRQIKANTCGTYTRLAVVGQNASTQHAPVTRWHLDLHRGLPLTPSQVHRCPRLACRACLERGFAYGVRCASAVAAAA